MRGVVNQSDTNNQISDCVTAKNHIIHMGTQEHHPISSSLKHVPLRNCVYCKYHTPTWQGRNFTSHLLLCMLFSETSDNCVRAVWNRAKKHMRLASLGLAPLLDAIDQGLQTFFSEGHAVGRGPDILRNTIVWDVLHSTKSIRFLFIYYCFIIDKIASRARWNGFKGLSLETPAVDRLMVNSIKTSFA